MNRIEARDVGRAAGLENEQLRKFVELWETNHRYNPPSLEVDGELCESIRSRVEAAVKTALEGRKIMDGGRFNHWALSSAPAVIYQGDQFPDEMLQEEGPKMESVRQLFRREQGPLAVVSVEFNAAARQLEDPKCLEAVQRFFNGLPPSVVSVRTSVANGPHMAVNELPGVGYLSLVPNVGRGHVGRQVNKGRIWAASSAQKLFNRDWKEHEAALAQGADLTVLT